MNFFEQQDQARRQTRWLLVLFVAAVIAIVAAIDLAVLATFGMQQLQEGESVSLGRLLSSNAALLAGASLVTLGVIGLASLFRILRLKSGGGKVARELGGTQVAPDSRDPAHQRLRNVVEEIALASGVPVPEIYVLEQEQSINAFAAGFTPADAAIAVTRGTLDKLSRAELQGVVAHEFSHIFNGDMRINIRLMGALFGILVLAVIGRRVVAHTRHVGGSRNKNAGGILLIAIALMVVGYIGLFFGRWIKAAVSRQREYLADASALQFTRDPDSIGGALKKIAVYGEGSYLTADTEEVGHMLFGAGQKMSLFATHPPLMERIQRIDPSFDRQGLLELGKRIHEEGERDARRVEREAAKATRERARGFDAGGIVQEIGNPSWERLMMAAAVVAALPESVNRAARSPEWAAELLLTCLLVPEPEQREEQLLIIARRLGADGESRVRQLAQASGGIRPDQRLPLLELALPMVKQRGIEDQARLLKVVEELIQLDGQVDVFEYLIGRQISQYLWEAANPRKAAKTGRRTLAALASEARTVLGLLALHGHEDTGAAQKAFAAGLGALGQEIVDLTALSPDWPGQLDRALSRLDQLSPEGKQSLVEAMIETALADSRVATAELELSRAICAALHVPVPVLAAPEAET